MILEGKTIVVCGVGTGLGSEVLRVAVRDGANVMAAARTQATLEAAAKEVDPSGERVAICPTDITDAAQCDALAQATVDRFGGIDALRASAAGVQPWQLSVGKGSTDVGDVSWAVPTTGLRTATWVPGTAAHSWQAVASGGTSIGVKGMIAANPMTWQRVTGSRGVDRILRRNTRAAAKATACPSRPLSRRMLACFRATLGFEAVDSAATKTARQIRPPYQM